MLCLGNGGCGKLGHQPRAVVHSRKICFGGFVEESGILWFFLSCFADLNCGGSSIARGPALDKPPRMREALRDGGCALVEWPSGSLQRGELTQDGVDHACGVRVAAGAGKLDALVEGSVRRDPVEVYELEGSKAERDGDGFGKPLIGALKERLDTGIQRDLPAKGAEDQRRRKIAVFRRERCRMRRMKKIVAVALSLGNEHENLEGSLSGG